MRIRKPLIVGPVAVDEAKDGSLVKILSTPSGVKVTGVKLGETIRIYTVDGVLQKSIQVEKQTTDIPLQKRKIYIVKVGGKSVKIGL
ncbi:MAG: hypothetical protein K5945_01460, partial [Bacteroidaceae bacterium]|nr:hypothetical protein [Bacteroidaceae bacterium]